MKKNKYKLKAGDIILAHNYYIFRWYDRMMTKSYWNHCLLYLGKNKMIDIGFWGIRILKYKNTYKNVEHKFIRARGLSNEKRKQICNYAKKFVYSKYNFALVFGLSGKEGTFTCSGFIHKIFAENGVTLCDTRLLVSPADINRSSKTYDIDNPPNKQKELENLAKTIIHIKTKYGITFDEMFENIKNLTK